MSGLDKVLISDMMEGFVTEAPPIPFVSYCVVCKVFLTKDEMVYEKGKVFHRECFEAHGKDFPEINQDVISQNSNTKVQLIQLKNLKIRQQEGLLKKKSSTKRKAKRKRTSKKKRPNRKKSKKKRTLSKRKKEKRYSRKKRTLAKRRKVSKKRKKPRGSKRRIKRRPSRRRISKRKTRRRR